MFCQRIAAATVMVLLQLAMQPPGTAWSQDPFNRDLERVSVWSEGPEGTGQRISAVWTFSVEPTTAPLDLSTDVVLLVNGTAVDMRHVGIEVDAGSGFCEDGPPCGGACGSAGVNGGMAAMTCYKDGICTQQFCDCDCGTWITSEFEGWDLALGDEITIILYPASGALPEWDTSDDTRTTVFHGRPIGWDRSIADVDFVEVNPGVFDIHVRGGAGWETQPGYGNLDFIVEARRNGVTLAAQGVPAELDGILDQSCWETECGGTCGSFNGVPRYCDPYLWWDCACYSGWLTIFPGYGMTPGDEITIILYPAPGALPEIARPGDNDSLVVTCCDAPSSVPSPSTDRAQALQQNRPNPFYPSTAIDFELAAGGDVRIGIHDAGGRLVRNILDRSMPAGRWTVTWDGRTEAGETAASGIYYCRLTTIHGMESRKLILRK